MCDIYKKNHWERQDFNMLLLGSLKARATFVTLRPV